MSNDIVESIKNQLANMPRGVDEDTRAIAGADFGKRISIKGGVFRLVVNGKEVSTVEDRYMDVIFVKASHTPSRQFYAQAFKEGEAIPPVCWSSDSITPDLSVENPQASACNTCPQAIQGTGQNGQGTACRLSWRTAVVLPQHPGGDVMQLVIPSASCWSKEDNGQWGFKPYAQMLAANNISLGRVISKMKFDTKSASPKLLFSPVGTISPQDLPIVEKQSKSDAAARAIELRIFKKKEQEAPAVAAPAEPPMPKKELTEQSELALPEPVLRKQGSATESNKVDEVPEILRKWQKKG